MLRGKNGNAGHAGHSFVVDDDTNALCGCGNVGDVEGLAAGNAIARRFGQPAAELFAAAARGEPEALATTDALCRVMGRMLYNLIATLDLQRISLGGSVFWNNRDFLLPRLQAQIDGKLVALTRGAVLVPPAWGTRSATTPRWPAGLTQRPVRPPSALVPPARPRIPRRSLPACAIPHRWRRRRASRS